MTTPGRRLLELPPSQWAELHRQRWPGELGAFQEAAGQVFARVLAGSADIRRTAFNQRGEIRVHLESVTSAERAALDLSIPAVDENGRLQHKSLSLQALLLPVAVRADATWVMTQLPADATVELNSVDAVASSLVFAPVMSDLSGVLRLRAGAESHTERGQAELLLRCRQAHDALGLRSDLIDPLLAPSATREEVVAARRALILSWAEHPADLGERLMALICARLVRAYYSKARKDGSVQEARVMNTRTQPLLDASLRNWEALVGYLGERLSDADARPVDVPDVLLPPSPPEPILERIAVLREWWMAYDALQAARQPGDSALQGLVPPRWSYADPETEGGDPELGHQELWRSALPRELVTQVEELWGRKVLPRTPSTLITEPQPYVRFSELLRPAIEIWEDFVSNCWSLCFQEWGGYSLSEMQPRHTNLRRELGRLDAAIDTAVYSALIEAGSGYSWLFERQGMIIRFEIFVEDGAPGVRQADDRPSAADAAAAFLALRRVIDRYRNKWLEERLDPMLDSMWRADLSAAASSYWKRYRGKGSPPTVKQALPDVLGAAQHWLGSDFGALARLIGLPGPVTQSPTLTSRQLPSDLPRVRRDVANILRRSVRDDGASRPQDMTYRIGEVAARVDDVLAFWQATGAAPPRTAVFSTSFGFIFKDFFGCDLEQGYQMLLGATADTLAAWGHPAAGDLSPA